MKEKLKSEILEKQSLGDYRSIYDTQTRQSYLSNVEDFWASRLKCLARTNCLLLSAVLFRMILKDCYACQTFCIGESVLHVLLECQAYIDIREPFITISFLICTITRS